MFLPRLLHGWNQHDGGEDNHPAADQAQAADGQAGSQHAEADYRCENAADAGEKRVHGHVVGHAVGRRGLGHPHAPGDIATGVGNAKENLPKMATQSKPWPPINTGAP